MGKQASSDMNAAERYPAPPTQPPRESTHTTNGPVSASQFVDFSMSNSLYYIFKNIMIIIMMTIEMSPAGDPTGDPAGDARTWEGDGPACRCKKATHN